MFIMLSFLHIESSYSILEKPPTPKKEAGVSLMKNAVIENGIFIFKIVVTIKPS